ncbi:hypothetical protein MRB53_005405 [Persea americana]|uniref:Uncharacterized protein n=1 Tax=Persea americana TaxID=3435 RepID=A0ACC2MDA2_PERAE|nr:hypothetical protein MRB53_005405 [Persea americana]
MRKLELVSIAWLLVLLPLAIANKVDGAGQAKPGCNDRCGNVTIKYPFGVGKDEKGHNCFLSKSFEVNCINGVPTLAKADLHKVFNISEIRFPNQVVLESCRIMAVDCTYTDQHPFIVNVSFDLASPFKVSAQANRFRAMGCDTTAYINNTGASFTSLCETQWMMSSGKKKQGGLGQCQIAVPGGSRGVLKWRMGKVSKIGCKMASHRLFKDKAKNWVNDLQGMFTDLQFARKESRSIDVAMLEEQVHQMLHEWKAELDEASPAPSLPLILFLSLDGVWRFVHILYGPIYVNTPQQRGMRRRCLVFDVGAHKKNAVDESKSDSLNSLQSEGKCASDDKKNWFLSSPKLVRQHSLHLNALASTSKDFRIVKHESLTSVMQDDL